MKCKDAVRRILESDHGHIPFMVQMHCRMCSKCMSELSDIRKAERMLQDKWFFSPEYDLSPRVLSQIRATSYATRKSTTWIPGLSVGVVLVASLFLVNFSDTFAWIELAMGDTFIIPVNIVLGLIISAYLAAFIASQIQRLSQYTHHGVKR